MENVYVVIPGRSKDEWEKNRKENTKMGMVVIVFE